MTYRVRLSLPALVEVVVDVDANSQQDAIVAGYDHALAATPETVKVISVSPQSAMLEACEALPAEEPKQGLEAPAVATPPVSSALAKTYSVRSYATPEAYAQREPRLEVPFDDYSTAVSTCRTLALEKTDYCQCVYDKFGNKLFRTTNEFGGFVVVVYEGPDAFAAREYQPWSGWHHTARAAKKEALKLLDAGRVFAVGVVDATTKPDSLIMNLSRSSS